MTQSLPLSRIRVLDLSRILAAPFASQILGDLGAEVIKVERPHKGDDSRTFGPPFMMDADGKRTRESSFYISANRNKKSISVDISKPEGQELIRKLALESDVLLENYKVGDLKRYGLDYASLSRINPRLVYCSLTGFGQTGPYSPRPGYDTVFQAMGGLMSVTGVADGEPGAGPMKTGPSLADILAGQNTAYAIIAALYHRDANGGQGQLIDVALLDSLIAATSHYAAQYLLSGEVPVRRGTEGNGGMPSRLFSCADGDIVIVAGNNEQWARLCQALGIPEVANDPRFAADSAKRAQNRKELVAILEPLIASWKASELLAQLDRMGVPAGPVNNMKQVFEDEQVRSREMCVEVEHALSPTGTIKLVANPVKFSGTPITRYTAPPMLGEHNHEVLASVLKMNEEQITQLKTKGVI